MWCKIYCLSHCSILIDDVGTPLHGLEGRKGMENKYTVNKFVDRICDATDAGSG